MPLVDGNALAELARHAPVPGDAVAETLDEGVDHVRIPDATVAGSGGGPELDAITLARDQSGIGAVRVMTAARPLSC